MKRILRRKFLLLYEFMDINRVLISLFEHEFFKYISVFFDRDLVVILLKEELK